jgi:hypothetical protein
MDYKILKGKITSGDYKLGFIEGSEWQKSRFNIKSFAAGIVTGLILAIIILEIILI